MSFRDQAIADLPTFTNVDEFGDTMTIESSGVSTAMACVLVNDEAPTDDEGVEVIESTLYARAVDFSVEPVVRQRIVIGGREANVVRVDEEQGMLVIRLRWFES